MVCASKRDGRYKYTKNMKCFIKMFCHQNVAKSKKKKSDYRVDKNKKSAEEKKSCKRFIKSAKTIDFFVYCFFVCLFAGYQRAIGIKLLLKEFYVSATEYRMRSAIESVVYIYYVICCKKSSCHEYPVEYLSSYPSL